jgi:PAS domain S-box-containing protein
MTGDARTEQLAPLNPAEKLEKDCLLALLDAVPDVVLLLDAQGLVTYVNERVRETLHYEPDELVGRSAVVISESLFAEVGEGDQISPLGSRVTRASADHVLEVLSKEGHALMMRARVTPLTSGAQHFTVVSLRDISAQAALERQLSGLQKVEAVGRLAGSVAHDFNNILTAITAFADAAYQSARPASLVRSNLEEVLAATEQARVLTTKLLDFARRRPIEPILVDINAIVRATERMVDVLLNRNIQVMRRLCTDLGLVRVDPGGIEQVILNLCVNACDAMPNGGTLTIETRRAVLSVEQAASFGPNVAAGSYVVLRVADTGVGMTDEVRRHAFEPFFSTKPGGSGSGLGLATCYGLVVQAGGCIGLQTRVGQGTDVDVYLPQVVISESNSVAATRPRGTVLLVEADPTVRQVAARELARGGFTTVTAGGWSEALDAVRDLSGNVDVLIVDLGMPATDGFELANRIRRVCPNSKVLFMSQHDLATLSERGAKLQETELLQKPFGTAELLAKIGALTPDP